MSTAAAEAYPAQFAEDEGYLDFARVGPPSRAAARAAAQALDAFVTAGPHTVDELMAAEAQALSTAGRLLGFPADHLVWTPSTSAGLFQVAFAVRSAQPAVVPRVLVSPGEFPANLYPWWRAAEAGRLHVDLLPPGPVTADVVRAALRPDVAALAVSVVDFATGHRADLAALRDVLADRLLVVDAIQGLGAVEAEWAAADVLVAGGQKWLRSGWSTGVLGVSDRAQDRLDPLLAGWTGVEDPSRYDGGQRPLAPGPARFSTTNGSPVAQAALSAGLALLESVSPAWVAGRIAERVADLLDLLDRHGAEVTSERDPARGSGIVAFRLGAVDAARAYTVLGEAGVTCTRHGDRVRLSVHATTTLGALDRVSDALSRMGAD